MNLNLLPYEKHRVAANAYTQRLNDIRDNMKTGESLYVNYSVSTDSRKREQLTRILTCAGVYPHFAMFRDAKGNRECFLWSEIKEIRDGKNRQYPF